MSVSEANEPMLDVQANRYVIFPIQHEDFWKMYKKAEANFWTSEELDLSKDLTDWENHRTQAEYSAYNDQPDSYKYYSLLRDRPIYRALVNSTWERKSWLLL